MKVKQSLSVFVLLIVFVCCSSNENRNLDCIEFMEIPIKGHVQSFGDKLAQKGYEFYSEDTIYRQLIYCGVYLNKQATIRLDYEEGTKNIKSARVIFNGDIPNTTAIINEYTEKYGKCNMEQKNGFIYYSWNPKEGKLTVSTCSSPIVTIEYSRNDR